MKNGAACVLLPPDCSYFLRCGRQRRKGEARGRGVDVRDEWWTLSAPTEGGCASWLRFPWVLGARGCRYLRLLFCWLHCCVVIIKIARSGLRCCGGENDKGQTVAVAPLHRSRGCSTRGGENTHACWLSRARSIWFLDCKSRENTYFRWRFKRSCAQCVSWSGWWWWQ